MYIKKALITIFLFSICVINANAYTESSIDITKMDIFEIQEAIDNKLINYETLIKLYLERIEEYNDDYNAIITINENILEEARECDKEYLENGRDSILFCMPIVVKDNIDVVGLPTTLGTKSLIDSFPNEDAEVIKNLKEKGALIIGKANMSEFAFEAQSSMSSYGTVKNAYNLNYTSYGSSGGTAVAVATGMAALGIGTDTNMSVRAPSSANNLYGMRPTYSVLSNSGVVNYDITRDTIGPITKTSKENAVLLAVMEGKEEDYYIKNSNNYTLEGKVIGVLNQFLEGNNSNLKEASETVKELFDSMVEKLEKAGATIIYIDDFYTSEHAYISSSTISGWTFCHAFNEYIKGTTSNIKSFEELTNSSGHIYSLSSYNEKCSNKIEIIDTYDEIKKNYLNDLVKLFNDNKLDAIIYPTTNNNLSTITENKISTNADYIAPVLGVPSISIPMGNSNGLYYGADLLGLKESEQILYEIAYSYEQNNKTYILPTISPTLYEIPTYVEELKEYYLENKNNKYSKLIDEEILNNYQETKKDIETFFLNYNDFNNKEETVLNLLNNYKNAISELDNYTQEINNKVILPIIIFVLTIILIKQKKKKVR